jgi:hypothetical protein
MELELDSNKKTEIEVVVHVNKMAYRWMEQSNFLCMNLRIMSHLGEGDLNIKTGSTLYVGMLITLVQCGD